MNQPENSSEISEAEITEGKEQFVALLSDTFEPRSITNYNFESYPIDITIERALGQKYTTSNTLNALHLLERATFDENITPEQKQKLINCVGENYTEVIKSHQELKSAFETSFEETKKSIKNIPECAEHQMFSIGGGSMMGKIHVYLRKLLAMNNLAGEFMESEYAESLDAIRETIKCISQNAYIFSCENHKSHIDDQQIALRIFYKGITLVKEHGFSFQDIFNEDKEEVISACRKRIETITSETLDDLEVFIRMANNQLDSL